MAKTKIIDSYSLECLVNEILGEIEQADNQINVYTDELQREKQHRQNDEIMKRTTDSLHDWVVRRDVLHQCLCKIRVQIKEIEI